MNLAHRGIGMDSTGRDGFRLLDRCASGLVDRIDNARPDHKFIALRDLDRRH
jgi:hypothetical protein